MAFFSRSITKCSRLFILLVLVSSVGFYLHSHSDKNIIEVNIAEANGRKDFFDGNAKLDYLFGIELSDLQKHAYNQNKLPLIFLEEYKNPCWLERLNEEKLQKYKISPFAAYGKKAISEMLPIFQERLKNSSDPWRMRCLPFFYLLGVTKSGTTDLFNVLLRHPEIHGPWVKEPMYWNRRRYPSGAKVHEGRSIVHWEFSSYLNMFDSFAHQINTTGNRHIVGDGSSYLFWEDNGWMGHPQNKGLSEPKVTTAMTMNAVQPHAKLIVIMRHPTDRLYSDYMYHGKLATPERFAAYVNRTLGLYRECMKIRTLRSCVFDVKLSMKTYPITLRASMYAVHLREWLKVYPREQIHVIKSEDYYSQRTSVLSKVLQFLEVDDFREGANSTIDELKPELKRHYKPMPDSTRKILNDFYEPFNKELEILLNRKMWSGAI